MCHHWANLICCHWTDQEIQCATTKQNRSAKKLQIFQRERGWRFLTAKYPRWKKSDAPYEIGAIKAWFSTPIALSGALAWLYLSKPRQMALLFLNKLCLPFVLVKNGATVHDETVPTLFSAQRWSVIWDLSSGVTAVHLILRMLL